MRSITSCHTLTTTNQAYVASKDLYVEKEATVNQEIEMYRLATLASLLSRDDVIIVASASSLYGLGQKEFLKIIVYYYK